jgi:cytochrome-b5 reductase
MFPCRYALPLAVKQRLNHDTYFMRFALPSARHLLGLPCGKHVFLCAGACWVRLA